MNMTTIKVSTELRDRIKCGSKERGLPAARLIESLLDAYERCRRMESFDRAFRGADAEYWDDFTPWDLSEGAVPDDV
ncbi:toxin-antitoxin system protein [Micrococcales bacterium 31B]|nr:toxin-antitoxin system protein [Micrococcales bacterium 31B]